MAAEEKPNKKYDPDFIEKVVKRVREGRLINEVVLEFGGLKERHVRQWVNEAATGKLNGHGGTVVSSKNNNQPMLPPSVNATADSTSKKQTRTRRVKSESDEDYCWTVPGKIGEKEENLSLEDTIDFNYERLETTFNELLGYTRLKAVLDDWLPNGSYNDFKQWFIEKINNGQITNETIGDWWHACLFRTSTDSDIGMLWSSFTFTILAQRALEQGQRDKGWALVARASYCCGLSGSVSAYEYFKTNDEKYLDSRGEGGDEKSKNYEPARKELIRLLNLPPEGGWVNTLRTRKFLAPLLDDSETKRMNNPETATTLRLAEYNLATLLSKWFKEVDILAAYNANSKETLSKPKLPSWE